MGISRRTRLAQKRRWRPTLAYIVRRTFRKHAPTIAAYMARDNALLRLIQRNGKFWDEARGIARD